MAILCAEVIDRKDTMHRSKKNGEREEQVRKGEKVPAKLEPLRPQAEQPNKLYNDLAKFPSENPYPVLRIHRNGTVLFANKASEELLKARGSGVGQPAPAQWRRLAENVLASGRVAREEVKDNGRVFAFRAVPIAENDYVNFYGVDITERKRAEEALQASEERFRSLFEQAADAIVVIDARTGEMAEFNNKAHQMLGYTRTEYAKLRLSDIEAIESKEEVAAHIDKIVRQGSDIFEAKQRKKDGTLCDVLVSSKLITVAGKPYLQAIWRDITERKRAEETLQISETRFRELFNNMSSGVAVYEAVDDGRDFVIKDFNGAAERIEKVGKESVIGKRVTEVFPGVKEMGLWDVFRRVWKTGKAEQYPTTLYKDSRISGWRENYIYKLPCGELVAVYDDVTERKRAEEELLWKTAFLESQVEANLDGVLVVDSNNQKILTNKRLIEMWKVPQHIVEDKDDTAFLQYAVSQTKYPEQFLEKVKYLYSHQDETSRDEIEFKNGMVLDRYSSPVVDKNGKYFGRIWTFRDITERKQAEEAMKKSNQLLRDTGEMAKVGGWELDLSTKEVFWTEETCRIHGLEPGHKLSLEEALNFYAPESRPALKTALKKTAETGEPCDLESLFIPSGSKDKIWVRSIGRAVYSGGKIVKLAGTFQNIDKYKRAEQALQASEERFRSLFEQAADAIVVIDARTGEMAEFNNKAHQMLGYTRTEYAKLRLSDIEAIESKEEVAAHIDKIVRQGSDIFEAKQRKKDGTLCDVLVSSKLITVAGKPYLQAIWRDITERKRAEEDLRRSEESYRVTFENTGSATVLIEDDTIISLANTEFERLSGFSKQEIEGKKSWTEFVVKEDLARMLEQHRLRRVNKEAAMKQYEFRFVTRTGNIRDIALLIDVIPGTKQSVAALMDITERRLTQERLQEERNLLRTLIDHIPNDVYVKDKDSRFIISNKAVTGYWDTQGKSNIIGKTDFDLFEPATAQEYFDEEQKIMQTGQSLANMERQITDKTGIAHYHMTTKLPLRDNSGNIVGIVGINRDVTERKKAEQKLLEYQKQLKRLAAQLSLAEERERRRIAGELHDHVSQSLAFAKIKLDSLHAALSSQPLAGVIEDISGSIEQAIQDTRTLTFDLSNPILYELGFEAAVSEWLNENVRDKHKINTEFQDDGQDKPLDDDMRALLFRNVRELLINTIKYANADKVRVSVRRIDGSIEVVVEDNGVGFDPVEVRTLASKRAEFGLFSIRESLEELGGHFEIESKPGAGCKATMTAPLKSQSRKKED
jgi:PAS domain S-box-containing protein